MQDADFEGDNWHETNSVFDGKGAVETTTAVEEIGGGKIIEHEEAGKEFTSTSTLADDNSKLLSTVAIPVNKPSLPELLTKFSSVVSDKDSEILMSEEWLTEENNGSIAFNSQRTFLS